MPKKDNIKTFIDEIHSTPHKKKYETNKIIYNHFDEVWSIDLADMIDYKTSNIKGFRYIIVFLDNVSKCFWTILLINKTIQTITREISIVTFYQFQNDYH